MYSTVHYRKQEIISKAEIYIFNKIKIDLRLYFEISRKVDSHRIWPGYTPDPQGSRDASQENIILSVVDIQS